MNKKVIAVLAAVVIGLAAIIVGVTVNNKKGKEKADIPESTTQGGSFQAVEGNYSLNISAVYEVPPETDEENPPQAERVVVVVYEYTNDDIESGLVIGNSHFKAFDEKGKELEQYPQKNLFEAGSIGTEGTLTAGVAFALNGEGNKIEVEYYNDVSSKKPDSVFQCEW